MANHTFDDREIYWQQLEGIEHLSYYILDVNRDSQIADVLLRFSAGEKILLHRHMALNHMLVIQGQHILYEPEGTIKEVRPTGRYTVSPASEEPHREGGGTDQDVVIMFSMRGTDGALYQFLDDELNVTGELGMEDLDNMFSLQKQALLQAAV